MKVYKGTDKDMRCRSLQYEIGKPAEVEGDISMCNNGLHACEMPLDVFNYYPPCSSRYFIGELDGVSDERGDDSKRVGRKLELKAELNIAGLVKAQINYVRERTTLEGETATGNQGAASATGDCGAASATGKNSVSVSTGVCGRVMGALGCAVVCVERGDWDGKTYPIESIMAAIVDGDKIKPGIWYTVKDGQWVEIEEE